MDEKLNINNRDNYLVDYPFEYPEEISFVRRHREMTRIHVVYAARSRNETYAQIMTLHNLPTSPGCWVRLPSCAHLLLVSLYESSGNSSGSGRLSITSPCAGLTGSRGRFSSFLTKSPTINCKD